MYDSNNGIWIQVTKSWWLKMYNFIASLKYIAYKI